MPAELGTAEAGRPAECRSVEGGRPSEFNPGEIGASDKGRLVEEHGPVTTRPKLIRVKRCKLRVNLACSQRAKESFEVAAIDGRIAHVEGLSTMPALDCGLQFLRGGVLNAMTFRQAAGVAVVVVATLQLYAPKIGHQ